jgi:hypothetical protein
MFFVAGRGGRPLPVLRKTMKTGAQEAVQCTTIHLSPTDVLPTGNEWISLADIRA